MTISHVQSMIHIFVHTILQFVHFYLTCGLFDGAMHVLGCCASAVLWSALPAVPCFVGRGLDQQEDPNTSKVQKNATC